MIRTTTRKMILCSLFLFSPSIFAASTQYTVTEKKIVNITAKFPGGMNAGTFIFARETISGKKFKMPFSSKDGENFNGRFNVDFAQFAETPTLEFSLDATFDKKLFIIAKPLKNAQRILLFRTESEADAFAKKDAQGKRSKVSEEEALIKGRLNLRTQEQERTNLEVQEVQKREVLTKAFEASSPIIKKNRTEQSEVKAKSADQLYAEGKYKEAADGYAAAFNLNPTIDSLYYRYAVSLYKNEEYNRSLAFLSIAESGAENRAEYSYYVGLNSMKLKDFERALDQFHSSRDENDKVISPMAAFFAGNIEFQLAQYDPAKEDFQYTLDNSQDPQVDKEAEKMLEKIDQMEAFIASTKEVFRYSIFAGYGYDANILSIAKQNLATDVGGLRTSYGVTGYYKIRQTMKSELGAQASYSDIYSTDYAGRANSTLQAADPLQMSIGLPYRQPFDAFAKNFLWSLTPAFSTITMDTDGKGRTKILESTTIDTDVMYQVNPKWISSYRLQWNKDTSYLAASSADDSQSGIRVTVGLMQALLLDDKATQKVAFDLSLADNAAEGKNNVYQKYIAGLIYSFPAMLNLNSMLKAELTSVAYSLNSNQRKDSIWTYSLGLNRSLTKTLSAAVNMSYTQSGSNLDQNRYDKAMYGAVLTYGGSFSKK